ncbi:HAD-IB family phosphatase [Ottowia thiooxydans]|uniref:phosphoserine phosphatase n=1 Tax=Ottowia thiooxydans TaxID=219182 RepID=A0ABV2QBV7_9BURK
MSVQTQPTTPVANVIFDFDLTVFPQESTLGLALFAIDGDEQLTRFVRSFGQKTTSLRGRLSHLSNYLKLVAKINRRNVRDFIDVSRRKIDPCFPELFADLRSKNVRVYFISSGYSEVISPLLGDLGIPGEDIRSNSFFWFNGHAVCPKPSVLHQPMGKVDIVRRWRTSGHLKGPIVMVGDGQADRNVYASGLVEGYVQASYYLKDCGFKTDGNFHVSHELSSLKTDLFGLLEKVQAS